MRNISLSELHICLEQQRNTVYFKKLLKVIWVQWNPFHFSKAFIGSPGTIPHRISLDDLGLTKMIDQ
jgi:hypothetical protein